MSKLLQERWLRLSGLLLEEEQPAQGEPDHSWYEGMATGDNVGTTVVSEIGFCLSIMDGGSLPTEAKLLEAANGDCFGAVDTTKAAIKKYVPAMKLHTKGGTDEVSYQLKTAQKAAQKAIAYIESTFQQAEITAGEEVTKASITGVQHSGIVAATGDGSNTGDVIVSFTDGDGKPGTQKISLKSYENITEKTKFKAGQGISLARRFQKFYPQTDHPMLARYLRELKAEDSNYSPVSSFRVITDWAYMKAGASIRDLMVADISNPDSDFSKSRDAAINKAKSGRSKVRSFNWTTDSKEFSDTTRNYTDEEIAAGLEDFNRQRRKQAGERVPGSAELNREPTNKPGGRQSATPKDFQKGGVKDKDGNRLPVRSSTEAGSDYAKMNAEMRPLTTEALAQLCNGAWAKSYAMTLIRRAAGVIVIAANPTIAIVAFPSESLQAAIDKAIEAPDEQFTLEPDGAGMAIKVNGTKIARFNYDLGGSDSWSIRAKGYLTEKYSLVARLLGTRRDLYKVDLLGALIF